MGWRTFAISVQPTLGGEAEGHTLRGRIVDLRAGEVGVDEQPLVGPVPVIASLDFGGRKIVNNLGHFSCDVAVTKLSRFSIRGIEDKRSEDRSVERNTPAGSRTLAWPRGGGHLVKQPDPPWRAKR